MFGQFLSFILTIITFSPSLHILKKSRLVWRSYIASGTSCFKGPRRRACGYCRPRNWSSTCASVKMPWIGSVIRSDSHWQCLKPCLRFMVTLNKEQKPGYFLPRGMLLLHLLISKEKHSNGKQWLSMKSEIIEQWILSWLNCYSGEMVQCGW